MLPEKHGIVRRIYEPPKVFRQRGKYVPPKYFYVKHSE